MWSGNCFQISERQLLLSRQDNFLAGDSERAGCLPATYHPENGEQPIKGAGEVMVSLLGAREHSGEKERASF